MKQNKWMAAILSLALVGAVAIPAFAAEPQRPMVTSAAPVSEGYSIEVDGQDTDVKPTIMVPLRAMAEQLDFQVTWENKTVLVDNGIVHTVVTPGLDRYVVTTSREGLVGMSAPFSLGAAPYVAGGVTYVPLELFRPLLGNRADAITVDGGKIRIETQAGKTQIPNPFETCASLDEAAKLAGFSFTVPAKPSGDTCEIQAIADQMIQVTYSGADGQTLLLRKAVGAQDISGDFTAYAQTNTVTVGTRTVTMRGDGGKVSVAIWTEGGYTYSISAPSAPLDAGAASQLVADIR